MKKSLVVDNNPVVLKFMKKLLERQGHQVLTAKDGLSALDVLRTYKPDVIFLDLIMPNIDGQKLCRIIRKTPDLKYAFVVIITAVAVEAELSVEELGANACIAKGSLDEIERHVLNILDQVERDPSLEIRYGQELGFKGVQARDITKELLFLQRHLETIFESMTEGIMEITSKGRITYVNPMALAFFGLPEEGLLSSSLVSIFPGKVDRKRIQGLLDRVKRRETKSENSLNITYNGKEFSLKALPLMNNGNETIIIISDVTEKKQISEQLQRAQKMEAIATLAGGMAHDFNNLLMVIQGNTSLMLLQTDASHPFYERLKGIELQVQSGSRLTSELLGYARIGKYEVKTTNLNLLVRETAETFGRSHKEIVIHQDLEEEILAIEADKGQIEQVLLNLFINAADAMIGGGDLFIQTRNTDYTLMKGRVYEPKPRKYVSLVIQDNGTGMDKKTQERIFDPFFTTKEMGRGTGLGLASVYGIVKGHGGYIEVESEKGHGSAFHMFLPAFERLVPEDLTFQGVILKGTETVLLVDDEEILLEVGRRLLGTMGYRVMTAGNGKEALDLLREHKEQIDIVILDLIMPDMGGGRTYDLMKEIHPAIKVLLSSGYSVDGEAAEILKRGCDGFIQKPFKVETLSHNIRQILDKKL